MVFASELGQAKLRTVFERSIVVVVVVEEEEEENYRL